MAAILPELIILHLGRLNNEQRSVLKKYFKLECIIKPFNSSSIALPLKKSNGDEVLFDSNHTVFKYFPEVPAIFDKLKKSGIKIGIISDTEVLFEAAPELLNLFGFEDYISFKEIHEAYALDDNEYIKNIQSKSRVSFDDMIYFTNWQYNIQAVYLELGIFSILLNPKLGITMEILDKALKEYPEYIEKRKKELIELEKTQHVQLDEAEKVGVQRLPDMKDEEPEKKTDDQKKPKKKKKKKADVTKPPKNQKGKKMPKKKKN